MEAVKAIVFIISCNLILSIADDSSEDPVVHLSTGSVKGKVLKGEAGNEFYSFKKIPYAEPPLGKLRFKAPVAKKAWNDVLDATEDGPSCTQLNFFTLEHEGEEDCLYLNVYTPKLPEHDDDLKMNVVYYITGGGFLAMAGTSSYIGPERFPLQDNVILVTVTYRVNVLGFFSTNDSVATGNYGMLDQVEGLKWVQKNIHHFGGDPKKVTLMGESAGGASVIYQMLSPLSKGLFHQAIAMSGTALGNWALQKDPKYWSTKLGKDIDCSTDSSKKLVDCLRKKSVTDIVDKGYLHLWGTPYLSMTPTVDHHFIDDTPLNIVKHKKYDTNVPLIIGSTKDEGNLFFLGRNPDDDFVDDEIDDDLRQTVDALPDVDKKLITVRKKYLGDLKSYKDREVLKHLGASLTDGMFHKPIIHTTKEMLKSGTKIYLYQYDYEAPFSASQFAHRSATYGVVHMDDLFMFFSGLYKVKKFDKKSEKVKNKFQNLFVNFIKGGNPNPDNSVDCAWPESKTKKISICHINLDCSVKVYEEKDPLYKFWVDGVNRN